MAGKSDAWDIDRRRQVGGEVRLARGCAVPWKTLEFVYGRSRQQLDRCLGEAADATKSRDDATCALLSRAAPRAIDRTMAEPIATSSAWVSVPACGNCPLWRAEKRPDREGKGRCTLLPPIGGVAAMTSDSEVCQSHPVIAGAREAASAAALVEAIADKIADKLAPVLRSRRKGK